MKTNSPSNTAANVAARLTSLAVKEAEKRLGWGPESSGPPGPIRAGQCDHWLLPGDPGGRSEASQPQEGEEEPGAARGMEWSGWGPQEGH